jgi:hypothetical protein
MRDKFLKNPTGLVWDVLLLLHQQKDPRLLTDY